MDIVEQMRSFESDHEPDGWPAVTMGQISALCDEIERLKSIIKAACNSLPVAFSPDEKTGENLVDSIDTWRKHVIDSEFRLANKASKFEESSNRYFLERNKLRDEVDRLQSLLDQERQESLTASCRVAALEMELDSAKSIIDELQRRFMNTSVDRNLLQGVINERQSPEVAVPDADVLASIIRKVDGAHLLGASALAERIVEELKTSQQSPRITEQDARIIAESAIHHYIFSDKGANIDNWIEDEGRDLLAKLNEAKHD